jgi:DNA repair protein RecO (recombination protein O)
LEALTAEFGRIGLVARGARSSRSRWKNMMQPFRPLLLSWNQKGELATLTGAEQVATTPELLGEALFCGLYCNELILRFLHRSDPHPGLFDHYRRLVSGLASGERPEPSLRLFEKQLLDAAGFGLQLERDDRTGEAIRPDALYLYMPETGPVERQDGRRADRELVSGAALLALKSGEIAEQHLNELKTLMRKLIRFHLGDKPLKSQSLFY